ncbi:MAG TPA: hypothetical protein VHY37_06120 [Tepidisphaeraceae bacterium]|jgi:hypothetical protein|nr:hypothetical protein [Tepidisphaeraceae bacterium]
METNGKELEQIEGQWEQLIRDSARFAGKRVRITVLAEQPETEDLRTRALNLIEKAKTIQVTPRTTPPTPFEQYLIEQARKQGLEI